MDSNPGPCDLGSTIQGFLSGEVLSGRWKFCLSKLCQLFLWVGLMSGFGDRPFNVSQRSAATNYIDYQRGSSREVEGLNPRASKDFCVIKIDLFHLCLDFRVLGDRQDYIVSGTAKIKTILSQLCGTRVDYRWCRRNSIHRFITAKLRPRHQSTGLNLLRDNNRDLSLRAQRWVKLKHLRLRVFRSWRSWT